MQAGITFLDMLILIAVAAFIIMQFTSFKLPKDDEKSKDFLKKLQDSDDNKDNVIPLKSVETVEKKKTAVAQRKKPKGFDALSGLEQIKYMDKGFDEKDFISGAEYAYDMYYNAVNDVDEETLDTFLAPKLVDQIMDRVEELDEKGQRSVTEIVDVKTVDIVDARLNGRTAIIDVKYVVDQKDYIVNAEDELVSGDEEKAKELTTVWTWARNVDEEDPNWELEEISRVS